MESPTMLYRADYVVGSSDLNNGMHDIYDCYYRVFDASEVGDRLANGWQEEPIYKTAEKSFIDCVRGYLKETKAYDETTEKKLDWLKSSLGKAETEESTSAAVGTPKKKAGKRAAQR